MKKFFMKSSVLALLSLGVFFSGCEKENDVVKSDGLQGLEKMMVTPKGDLSNFRTAHSFCGTAKTVRLMAGQSIPIGEVSAYNDNDSLYITISIEGGYAKNWFIRKASLYMGEHSSTTGMKNPAPGKFPEVNDFPSTNNTGVQVHTFSFSKTPLLNWGEFDIALYADVVRVAIDADDNIIYTDGMASVVQNEGAWGEGHKFSALPNIKSNNWAMYFCYQLQACNTTCSPSWFRIVTRSNNGEIIEEIDFNEYDISKDEKIVGKVTYRRQNDNTTSPHTYRITAIFEITETGYTYDEFSAIHSNSAIPTGITRSSFSSFRTDATGGTITFSGIPQTEGTYWLGLYAKITGSCD
jgi:hypothetical protein